MRFNFCNPDTEITNESPQECSSRSSITVRDMCCQHLKPKCLFHFVSCLLSLVFIAIIRDATTFLTFHETRRSTTFSKAITASTARISRSLELYKLVKVLKKSHHYSLPDTSHRRSCFFWTSLRLLMDH